MVITGRESLLYIRGYNKAMTKIDQGQWLCIKILQYFQPMQGPEGAFLQIAGILI
jgi:hypothetical protein